MNLRRAALVLSLLAGCTSELPIDRDLRALCAASDECPGDMVCIDGVGRCSVLDNPCIERDGDRYVPVDQPNVCALNAGDGICVEGGCVASVCGDEILDLNLRQEGCDDGALNELLLPDGCRPDCQPARCGDGVTDPLRGETCDLGADNGPLSTCSTACTNACGDGAPQAGEACDDGDLENGDGCDVNCTPSACGNGIKAPDESCDDENLTDGDGCDSNCRATSCGNGVETVGEACDDGNFVNGDGCDANCMPTGCGNGIPSVGEECDDTNLDDDDGCDSNCTVTRCGNGVETSGEGCDDGNFVNGDGCDHNCTATACGNNVVSPGEECDDGNLTNDDGCDANCTVTRCGNGEATGDEECDDGNANGGDGCDPNCRTSGCPNGWVAGSEQCDDGNGVDGDKCDSNCTVSACGNNVVVGPAAGGTEECDDGDLISNDGCDANCRSTGCGNGYVTPGEECDDGNLLEEPTCTPGPGCFACDPNCQIPGCGNGFHSSATGEACDDGNFIDNDGCDRNCTVTACGNGIIAGAETCDDENDDPGDGCGATCVIESGWSCRATGPAPYCSTLCGDGLVVGAEQCDDNDIDSSDGCDACVVSAGYGCYGAPSTCVPVLFVDASVTASGVGTTWATAFKTLGEALTAAQTASPPTREIWVANGTYRPATSDRTSSFFLPAGTTQLMLYGGFAGGELRRETRNPTLNETILSGDLSNNDGDPFTNRTDNSCRIFNILGSALATTGLDGFILEGGEADGTATCGGAVFGARGGGMTIAQGARPTLRNLIFRDNQASARGGAMWIEGGTGIRLEASTYLANRASQGGAIFVDAMSPSSLSTGLAVIGCLFDGNVAAASVGAAAGGAIYGNDAFLLTYNSVFRNNTALTGTGGHGGAIYWTAAQNSTPRLGPSIVNSLFHDNNALSSGQAITADNVGGELSPLGPGLYLTFSTFFNNDVATRAGASRLVGTLCTSSIVHNGGLNDTTLATRTANSCFFNSVWSGLGSGNVVDADPNLDSSYSPNSGSPVIDVAAAAPSFTQAVDACDADGDNDRVEILAYDLRADPCDIDGDGNVSENLPLDLGGGPRLVDVPAVGQSGANARDIGAQER